MLQEVLNKLTLIELRNIIRDANMRIKELSEKKRAAYDDMLKKSNSNCPFEFYGQEVFVTSWNRSLGKFAGDQATFELSNGSKIVFDITWEE